MCGNERMTHDRLKSVTQASLFNLFLTPCGNSSIHSFIGEIQSFIHVLLRVSRFFWIGVGCSSRICESRQQKRPRERDPSFPPKCSLVVEARERDRTPRLPHQPFIHSFIHLLASSSSSSSSHTHVLRFITCCTTTISTHHSDPHHLTRTQQQPQTNAATNTTTSAS